jgi:hypothetical protein
MTQLELIRDKPNQPIKRGNKPQYQPRHQPTIDEIAQFWTFYVDVLIDVQLANDYKQGWIAFELLKCRLKPTIEAWEYLAECLGYKPAWAFHKFNEWK